MAGMQNLYLAISVRLICNEPLQFNM